jgi:hypothetical protein
MQLHGGQRGIHAGAHCPQLGPDRIGFGGPFRGCLLDARTRQLHLRVHIDAAVLKDLETADGLAELLALRHVLDGQFEEPLGGAQQFGCVQDATDLDGALHHPGDVTAPRNDRSLAKRDVLEAQAGPAAAIRFGQRPHGHAGRARFHVQQKWAQLGVTRGDQPPVRWMRRRGIGHGACQAQGSLRIGLHLAGAGGMGKLLQVQGGPQDGIPGQKRCQKLIGRT